MTADSPFPMVFSLAGDTTRMLLFLLHNEWTASVRANEHADELKRLESNLEEVKKTIERLNALEGRAEGQHEPTVKNNLSDHEVENRLYSLQRGTNQPIQWGNYVDNGPEARARTYRGPEENRLVPRRSTFTQTGSTQEKVLQAVKKIEHLGADLSKMLQSTEGEKAPTDQDLRTREFEQIGCALRPINHELINLNDALGESASEHCKDDKQAMTILHALSLRIACQLSARAAPYRRSLPAREATARETTDHKASETVIAVAGVTGAGKSTFINSWTGTQVSRGLDANVPTYYFNMRQPTPTLSDSPLDPLLLPEVEHENKDDKNLRINQESKKCLHEWCPLISKTPKDLPRHEAGHHEDSYTCRLRDCVKKGINGFLRKDKLTEHLRECHSRGMCEDWDESSGTRGRGEDDGNVLPPGWSNMANKISPGEHFRRPAFEDHSTCALEVLGGDYHHATLLSEAQMKALDQLKPKKIASGSSDSDQWMHLYSLLFPGPDQYIPQKCASNTHQSLKRMHSRFVKNLATASALGTCLLSNVVINNHHNLMARALKRNIACSGSIIPIPNGMLNLFMVSASLLVMLKCQLTLPQLDRLDPGETANILLLLAFAAHAVGTASLLYKNDHARILLLGGILTAFGLGLFTRCPFHAAVLDFMPWTILTAALLGAFASRKIPRKDKSDEHDHEKHSLSAQWDLLERGAQHDEFGYPTFQKTPNRDSAYERQEA